MQKWENIYLLIIPDENEYDFARVIYQPTASDPLKIPGKPDYSCSFCCKNFKTKQSLNTHQNFACQFKNEKKYVCKYCKKKYLTKHQLTIHEGKCFTKKRKQE